MPILVGLLRHGRAAGHDALAPLHPLGVAGVRALAEQLAGEGARPVAAFSSPLARARATADLVVGRLAPGLAVTEWPELLPDHDPVDTAEVLRAHNLPAGLTLVVAHLPLLGLLATHWTGQDPGFWPGTYVEIELSADGRGGRQRRRLDPDSRPG